MIGLGLMYKCYSIFLFKDPHPTKNYRTSPFTQIFKNRNKSSLSEVKRKGTKIK